MICSVCGGNHSGVDLVKEGQLMTKKDVTVGQLFEKAEIIIPEGFELVLEYTQFACRPRFQYLDNDGNWYPAAGIEGCLAKDYLPTIESHKILKAAYDALEDGE